MLTSDNRLSSLHAPVSGSDRPTGLPLDLDESVELHPSQDDFAEPGTSGVVVAPATPRIRESSQL